VWDILVSPFDSVEASVVAVIYTGTLRNIALLQLVLVALAACSAPARAPAPASRAVAWTYEVAFGADGNLTVEGVFEGPVGDGLSIESGVEHFVDGLSVRDGASFRPIGWHDARVLGACAPECTVRYRLRLKEAAAALTDVDVALRSGEVLFSPPSTWLVHPTPVAAGRYRFHVTPPPGLAFATGVRRGAVENSFEASTESFEESSFAAFGPLRIQRIAEPAIDLVLAPGLSLSDETVVRWAKTELELVTRYIGRSPSDSLSLFVLPGTSEVMRGKTLGGGGASVLVRVGTAVSEATLMDDWVLCHELIHVGFPSTERWQPWFFEGLASYVEPIVRVRAGLLSKERFWRDLVDGLPQGLPSPGDKGLEHDDSWGRIYWGGSLYFLLADLAIRERTGGERSLEDAVRAVVASGGNVESFAPLRRVLEVGDRATGTNVLEELYERLAKKPGTEDLEALWKRLGVVRDGKTVRFDDGSSGAALRDSVSAERPSVATK
jgi:hypothetical protein